VDGSIAGRPSGLAIRCGPPFKCLGDECPLWIELRTPCCRRIQKSDFGCFQGTRRESCLPDKAAKIKHGAGVMQAGFCFCASFPQHGLLRLNPALPRTSPTCRRRRASAGTANRDLTPPATFKISMPKAAMLWWGTSDSLISPPTTYFHHGWWSRY